MPSFLVKPRGALTPTKHETGQMGFRPKYIFGAIANDRVSPLTLRWIELRSDDSPGNSHPLGNC